MILDFNKDWRFRKEDGIFTHVDLPHDATLIEPRQADCRNGVNTGYFPGGIYEYEKDFIIDDSEKSYVLHFEGVYQNCTVSVNGKEAGRHR